MTEANAWRPCSACKKPIPLGALYYVCSVSTCNRPRTGLVFCDVSCWEVHLPIARHREAWAEEQTAPRTTAEAKPASTRAAPPRATPSQAASERAPRRSLARSAAPAGGSAAPAAEQPPQEVLIVASRLKDYVRARAGMNTSDRVLEPLSKIVRAAVDEAIRNARNDERKTILDRDVPKPR